MFMHKINMVKVDMNDLDSIRKAERLKAKFENRGLNLQKTYHIGFTKFALVYG
jgi:hypothetical protein